MPKQRLLTLISIGLIIAGAVLTYLGLEREVVLIVDGQPHSIRTRALTLGSIVRQAGLTPGPKDRLTPAASSWMLSTTRARLDRAAHVTLGNSQDDPTQ